MLKIDILIFSLFDCSFEYLEKFIVDQNEEECNKYVKDMNSSKYILKSHLIPEITDPIVFCCYEYSRDERV